MLDVWSKELDPIAYKPTSCQKPQTTVQLEGRGPSLLSILEPAFFQARLRSLG